MRATCARLSFSWLRARGLRISRRECGIPRTSNEPTPGGDHRDGHVRGAGPRALPPPGSSRTSAARTRPLTALSIALLGLGLGAFVRVASRTWTAPHRAAPALAAALLGLAVASIAGVGSDGDSWRCRWCRSRSRACWSRTRMPRAAAPARARPMPSICSRRRAAVWWRRGYSGPLSPSEIMALLDPPLRARAAAAPALRDRDRTGRGGARELARDRAVGALPDGRSRRCSRMDLRPRRRWSRRQARPRATCSMRRGAHSVGSTCTRHPRIATRDWACSPTA